jgi:indolepyruvate ferredoxin oxidoreductase beta subunit
MYHGGDVEMPIDKEPLNIIITGVGGQGNILASELVATAAVEAGYVVTVGETYGASQRGGTVMSHVRISQREQFGPLTPTGEADIVVGFEPLETLRMLVFFGNPSTQVILNSRPNYPISVLSGDAKYPEWSELVAAIQDMAAHVQIVEATELAKAAGNSLSANVVMVGCLAGSGLLPLSLDSYRQVLARSFTGSHLEVNLKAFDAGVAAVASA